MSFYQRRILPRLLDTMMGNNPELERLRVEILAPARGRVLEIGFGTGLNAAHYPQGLERVVAVDSNPGVESLARRRIARASVPIEFQLGSGERLPFENRTFDTVVTTMVLCAVSDVDGALAEIRRVLVPGGRYLLMEHGLATDVKVQKWQRRLNALSQRILGCRLDCPTSEAVTRAGFRAQSVKQFYMANAPRFGGFLTVGCVEST